jgi:hypothetical protein
MRTTRCEADVHRGKIPRRRHLKSGCVFAGVRWRTPFDDHRRSEVVAADRKRDGGPRSGHAGDVGDGGEELVVEGDLPRLILRANAAERNVERQQVLRVDSCVDVGERGKTPEQQTGSDEEHDRDGDLHDHERVTDAGSARAG